MGDAPDTTPNPDEVKRWPRGSRVGWKLRERRKKFKLKPSWIETENVRSLENEIQQAGSSDEDTTGILEVHMVAGIVSQL